MLLESVLNTIHNALKLEEQYATNPKLEDMVAQINSYVVYHPSLIPLTGESTGLDLKMVLQQLDHRAQLAILAKYTQVAANDNPSPVIIEREKTRFRMTMSKYAMFFFFFITIAVVMIQGISVIAEGAGPGADVFEHVINTTSEILKYLTTGL